MYAVIETGGKQYRVQLGEIVQVEKLEGEVGTSVEFNQILFFSHEKESSSTFLIGQPVLKDAKVSAEIISQGRGEKILIMKMKRRKQYRRTQGHRQNYTQFLVTGMVSGTGVQETLTEEMKQTHLSQFQTHLKPKGLASTPRILGSKVRRANALLKAHNDQSAATTNQPAAL